MSNYILKLQAITKLRVAEEQLLEAITMFFEGRSAIAIHTLVHAAHQVLHDYTGRTESMIKTTAALSEHGQQLIKRYNKEFNFFKHAKDDRSDTLHFDPELHTFFLIDAIYIYARATGRWPHAHQVFNFWFILRSPNMVDATSAKDAVAQALQGGWSADNRLAFLELLNRPGIGFQVPMLKSQA